MAAILANYAYAEGAWTPVFTCMGTAPTGLTYETQVGRYIRVGNLVTAGIQLKLSSIGTGGAGVLAVGGLPLFPGTDTFLSPMAGSGFDLTTGVLYLSPQTGATLALVVLNTLGSGPVYLTYTNLLAAAQINGTLLYNV